jgi:hypothetical protein
MTPGRYRLMVSSADQSIHGMSLLVFGVCAAAVCGAAVAFGNWWLAALMAVAAVVQLAWAVCSGGCPEASLNQVPGSTNGFTAIN